MTNSYTKGIADAHVKHNAANKLVDKQASKDLANRYNLIALAAERINNRNDAY